MKKYRVVFHKAFKSQMTYRAAMLTGIVSAVLSFSIQLCLWYALLGTRLHNGTSFTDMVLYVIVNTFVSTLTKANLSTTIENAIVDGSIAIEILRPISYKYFQFFSIIGKNMFSVLTNVLPIVLLGAFFLDKTVIPGPVQICLFLVSLILGVYLMFELTYLFGLLAFRIQRCWFLSWYINAFTTFFGGTAVPLWFYPKALQTVTYILPFRYITFEPVNLLLGNTAVSEAWIPLAAALAWIFVLTVIEKFMWRSAVTGLTVNGG